MASTRMYLSVAMTAHVTLRSVPTAGGSAVISSTLQETGVASHSGETTVLIGLAIQLFFFALFACLTVYIYRADRAKAACVPMQVYLCMWLTMFGISVRNVYRIIEIGIGWAGYLNTHEVMHLQVLHLQSAVPCLPVWTACKDGCASALSMLMLTRVAAASDVCHVPVCMQLELVQWHIAMQTIAQQNSAGPSAAGLFLLLGRSSYSPDLPGVHCAALRQVSARPVCCSRGCGSSPP